MNIRRILSLMMVLALTLVLAACESGAPAGPVGPGVSGGVAAPAEPSEPGDASAPKDPSVPDAPPASPAFVFQEPIEILYDGGKHYARLIEMLGAELGVEVTAKQIGGRSEIYEYLISQPADGRTWLLASSVHLDDQIYGITNFDIHGSVKAVCSLIRSGVVFVTREDAPYNSYEELMQYVGDGQVKCISVSEASAITGIPAMLLFGDRLDRDPFSGYAWGEFADKSNEELLAGGYVDVAYGSPGPAFRLLQQGGFKALLACTEVRMASFPDAECAGELGLDCCVGPWTGVVCHPDVPQEMIDAFAAAAERTLASQEYQDWAVEFGAHQLPGWMGPADFQERWDSDYALLMEMYREGY